MKKQRLFSATVIGLFALLALWSCKDDFTEEDLINKQAALSLDSIDLSILVYNASTSFTSLSNGEEDDDDCYDCRTKSSNALAGLTVTIAKNGKIVSVTTDATGIALFKGVQPGTVTGSVSGAGFTTTNFVVSVKEGESSNGSNEPTTNAGAVIPVFDTSGANSATVNGYATCELNLLNSTPENVPDGTKVSFSIDTSSDSFEELLSALLGLGLFEESVTSASVDKLSFEGNFVATVTNGTFSIKLPTSHHGLKYNYSFSDFTANQQIAVNNFLYETPGSLRSVQTISTQFGQDIDYTYSEQVYIPELAAVQLDIAAPPVAGTGATATAALMPAAAMIDLTPGSGYSILASGSGYGISQTGIPVVVSGGSFDGTVTGAVTAALTANSDAQGRIVSLSGTLGFGYKSPVTIAVGGTGAGAVIRPAFQSTVTPLFGLATTLGATKTTLTAGGTGYAIAPTVVLVGLNASGQQITEEVSATISNGSVVSFSTPVGSYASAPTITFRPVTRSNATAYLNSIDESSGTITGVYINNGGSGYNPSAPPAVTIRDLRNLGTGAAIAAQTASTGYISGLQIVSGGSAYSTLGYSYSYYANYPTSYHGFYSDNESLILRAGITQNVNAYYGTGVHARGLQ